jgi:uncharacterized protein
VTTPTTLEPSAPRLLPKLNDANRTFWTGGRTGRLLVPRCTQCHQWVLPPTAACPRCQGPTAYEAVSGRATVFSYTTNWQRFHPDVAPPNLIAIVVLEEQDDLRLATNLVDCEEADVESGMAVTVLFERHGEIYYPIFRPGTSARHGQ